MAGETRKIGEFISAAKFQDFPADVVHQAKRLVLDHLGIAILGATSVPGRTVVETVKQLGGREESTIVGQSGLTSCLLAPLANGTMAYSQMIDDIYPGRSHLHPGNCVIPPTLALGERGHISGKEFLTAMIVGYEVSCRTADAVGRTHTELKFYEGSANPHFASGAAAAKVLGLDTDKCCHALGMVGAMACGMWEDGVIQSTYQPVHAGKSSSSGVLAALLAINGLSAGDTIYEGRTGKTGYLNVFSKEPDTEALVGGLGSTWRMGGVGFKFHAAAGGIQPSVDAMIALRNKHRVDPKDVEKITVRGNRIELSNHNTPDPQNNFGGVQSSQYCVSRALISGKVLASDMTAERLYEPDVRELMSKAGIELDPEHDKALMTPPDHLVSATVVVRTKDGKVYEETAKAAKGMPANPASDQDVENKYYDLVSGIISKDKADAIHKLVWSLEEAGDIRDLAALLRP
jgi:2-methylcitrate dehydratase PrpD